MRNPSIAGVPSRASAPSDFVERVVTADVFAHDVSIARARSPMPAACTVFVSSVQRLLLGQLLRRAPECVATDIESVSSTRVGSAHRFVDRLDAAQSAPGARDECRARAPSSRAACVGSESGSAARCRGSRDDVDALDVRRRLRRSPSVSAEADGEILEIARRAHHDDVRPPLYTSAIGTSSATVACPMSRRSIGHRVTRTHSRRRLAYARCRIDAPVTRRPLFRVGARLSPSRDSGRTASRSGP